MTLAAVTRAWPPPQYLQSGMSVELVEEVHQQVYLE